MGRTRAAFLGNDGLVPKQATLARADRPLGDVRAEFVVPAR
jgi:hypothetical protein